MRGGWQEMAAEASPAEELSEIRVAAALRPIHERGDRMATRFILGHAVLTLLLAPIYGTWLISLVWGVLNVAAWFLAVRIGPGSFWTRATAGIVLESFCALHIWQMHGQPEQHFWFFVGFTMMIVYQDWVCMWPGALLIILQHTVFAGLHNQGMNLHFFPEARVDWLKLLFHFGIAIVHVAVCGYWAWLLRRQTLKDTLHTLELGRDLAERHRAEAQLKASQQGLRLALDAARMAGWELSAEKALTFSSNAEAIFGSSPESIPTHLDQLLDRVHPLDRAAVSRWFEDPTGPGEDRQLEYRLVDPDGSVRWILQRGQLLQAEGEPARLVGVVSDDSERRSEEQRHRQLELKVQHAQKLESLGVLAGGVAHDFNNLLVAILGNASFVRQTIPEQSPAAEPVREIEAAAHRAADLTRQMLAYSGRGKFIFERVALANRVGEIGKLLASMIAKKTELHYDLAADVPPVMADPTQIDQVIMNLVTNASEALGEDGGVVTIRTGTIEVDERMADLLVHGEDLEPGRYSYLQVEDEGIGMAPATVSRIFDPFFTTKFTGRGLGLAAVLGIVRGHHGGIRVETTPGVGSRLTAFFPSAPAAPESVAPPHGRPSGAGWRAAGLVLVIDDEPAVRRLATRVLEGRGFEVKSASDGLEGLALFEECQNDVSLVLLDWTMPGLSGEEVLIGIHRRRPDIPVLISSGYAEGDLADRLPEPGPAGFVPKPYRTEELVAAVRRALAWDPVGA